MKQHNIMRLPVDEVNLHESCIRFNQEHWGYLMRYITDILHARMSVCFDSSHCWPSGFSVPPPPER